MAIVSTNVYDSKDDLPLVDNKLGDVRFVKSDDEDPTIFIWNGTKWISTKSDIDLSEYVTKTEFNVVKDKVDETYPKAHTHENKDILDGITQADRDKFDDLHNYDDTEIRQLIEETGHTHPNKALLDTITQSSLWSSTDRTKFNDLYNYDDTQVKFRLVTLEEKAHTHENKTVLDGITQEKLDEIDELAATYVIIKENLIDLKEKSHSHWNYDILNGTTATYTTAQQRDLERVASISTFLGAGPTWNGVFGYVPAPEMGQQTYFLRADGTWAKVKSTGDKYKAGEGITILSGEVISDTFPFEIFPKAATVTQYIIYGTASGVGNLVSGRYEIPIKVSAPGYSDRIQTITVNDPLYDGDYIDYQKQVFVHYRTKISDRIEQDPNYCYEQAIYSDGHIGYFSPGSYGGSPVVSKPFELTPGASYELRPWDSSGQRYSRFHDGMHINIYDVNMNRTRTLYQEHLGNTVIVVADGEKYMRMTMQYRNEPLGRNGYQDLYMLYPVESPCQLQQLTLYPGVINTIDVLTTNKPNEIYIEVVQPEEPDPSDPSSDYTGIIYNDGILDVEQEDPDNLNELTFHFRDDVDKVITIPSASEMTGATASTDGEEGLVPAPLAGDENKFLRGDGTWQDVEGSITYYPGQGIEFGGETLIPTEFVESDFIRVVSAYHGTISKSAGLNSFTLTATDSDCYTDHYNGFDGYFIPAEPNTKYRVSWSSVNGTHGNMFVFEVSGTDYTGVMYIANNANTNENIFTTSSTCNKLSLRFGVAVAGTSETYSNITFDKVVSLNNVINAKLGNGLQFDANGAIEAIGGGGTQYVRVNTTDSFLLLHAKPADWDDNWSNYFELRYDELTASPPDWDPTKHYKYENDNYVLGTAGDTFVSTTWYDKHYVGLDPSTPVVFDSDVYYTGDLHLIEDGETFDTAFEKVNEAIEHIGQLEQEVQFLKDDKIGVRTTSAPEQIEFYNRK
jgi:hypothetical protein